MATKSGLKLRGDAALKRKRLVILTCIIGLAFCKCCKVRAPSVAFGDGQGQTDPNIFNGVKSHREEVPSDFIT